MAEINFNTLYNQLSPMEKDQYDGVFGSSGFKDKYAQNPDSSLVTQNSNYQKFKTIADAQTQVPETSIFDILNPFSKLSAAEMPQVPNLSLGTPQINLNTGITGASSAIPNINGVPMINTGAINQKLQNTDLVSQIIAANQTANANKFGNTVSPFPGNQVPQINNQVPQNFEFLQSAYEDQDEDAAQVKYLPGQKKTLKDSLSGLGRNFGISSLIGMITGNPIFGLLSRGLGSLGALNNRMQNSDFGRSKTLADYFDARKYGGIDARNRAAQQNMREARAIQTQVDRRGDSTSRVADRNRSSVTRSSAAKSSGVGGGGYTKSDSNRESYRG
mgnify:FL=1